MIDLKIIEKATLFRQTLHQHPELSGGEEKTSTRIRNLLKDYPNLEVIEFPGTFSLLVVCDSGKPGKTVVFRGDIDALPVTESEKNQVVSKTEGISHACGHDGHSAILVATAMHFSAFPPLSGKVVLLFQAEEETGQGAVKVVHDEVFTTFQPDFIFGIHNLPGFPLGAIVVREQSFACASAGIICRLIGKTSHAAEPELGISPIPAISDMIISFKALNENKTFFEDFVLITPIHIRAGEVAFGTSPGDAVFMLTLRAATEKDFMMLKSMVSAIAIQTAESYKLESKISYVEEFPATVNHPDCVAILKSAAGEVIVPEGPFRWSEDFGYYGRMAPAALFGIGSGEDCPVLHSPEYSFPDEIIPKAVEVIVKTALVAGMV